MEYRTSRLCDIYLDQVDVLEPMFTSFGGCLSFSGQVTTVKCFEDNNLIIEALESKGEGRVLVIDGGGSLRRALIDANIAQLALDNNWEGIIVNGCIRDVDELEEIEIGIQALASIPVGVKNNDSGELDVPVNFASVTILPEDYIYADTTGIILSSEPLDMYLDEDEDEEILD